MYSTGLSKLSLFNFLEKYSSSSSPSSLICLPEPVDTYLSANEYLSFSWVSIASLHLAWVFYPLLKVLAIPIDSFYDDDLGEYPLRVDPFVDSK